MKLNDFYQNTNKNFDVTITYNAIAPNIVNDEVTIEFTTIKGGPVIITKNADVTTSGATGVAQFRLTSTDTDVPHGKYYYEIFWKLDSGEEYVLDSNKISILERV